MGEIVNIYHSNEVDKKEKDLIELTEEMLLDARSTINSKNTLSVPIAELSTLGAGVASLIPALNTVTQTTTFATEGLYQLANAGVGDVLKVAKNGNFWGAFKTADGASKFAQLQAAGPLSATTTTAAAINPAIMLMSVALFSIEKELGKIAEIEEQILLFLEVEKESEIEADIETLMNIVTKYKLNWDNVNFVASNHKLVLDIQRTARKNMNAYQKKINEAVKAKQFIVVQNKVNSTLADLEKKFKYFRLSLFTFSLASLMEIMLCGNFKEEYILGIKDEISFMSQTYRDLFEKCSVRLEKMGNSALESNVIKGLGSAGKAVGKFIGNIPLAKEGVVDEFLQDKGDYLKSNAIEMEKKYVGAFAAIGDPGTGMLVEKMNDMVQIYNHTTGICFDKEKIYLMTN
ncbi:hypothetical protein Q5O24_09570 [Eubacteriaceae bacterium ES3]|nr:hypothetical protein Q5O24_09570 [Eubacteriaceae bacterium ES3]